MGTPQAAGLRDGPGELRSGPARSLLRAKLIRTERTLTLPDGLSGRPWFRHQIYAPGFYTGYGVKTLPGVREAIDTLKETIPLWKKEVYVGGEGHSASMDSDNLHPRLLVWDAYLQLLEHSLRLEPHLEDIRRDGDVLRFRVRLWGLNRAPLFAGFSGRRALGEVASGRAARDRAWRRACPARG